MMTLYMVALPVLYVEVGMQVFENLDSSSRSYQYFCMIFIIAPYDMLLYLSVFVDN